MVKLLTSTTAVRSTFRLPHFSDMKAGGLMRFFTLFLRQLTPSCDEESRQTVRFDTLPPDALKSFKEQIRDRSGLWARVPLKKRGSREPYALRL
jgi:hypothetical protein